ncbi:polysaccharide pyruvyl transferase family protein [Gramella sp. GC03-9]|uniref:Polysaccharide pyruvyl transferase family protein n=1 Tax=Christiangramia oceanisediminis TaxID=2920386 RepID=A0A9X2HZV4_9FLAO|nr:polysaccharide pyruvyl transferase family protein [Gramella oceanisediminis]MCP9198326.1 polysaccharide pyruvyl transferase family protein [Gramella oceanisediminis]
MLNKNQIPLFWWSETRLMGKKKENYGDLLSKYVVEKISGKPVEWVQPKKMPWYKRNKINFLAAGSIIHHCNSHSTVWGSGIIDRNQKVTNAIFKAVRGPRTRRYLIDLGYNCPQVFGDPALLLPLYFQPKGQKKFRFGIIPHYHDYQKIEEIFRDVEGVKVVDLMTLNTEDVTEQIFSCEKVISSSLHGLIVSHAYEIPAIWVKFSERLFGDGVKFIDYFESIGVEYGSPSAWCEFKTYEELECEFHNRISLPKKETILRLQKDLIASCPFL